MIYKEDKKMKFYVIKVPRFVGRLLIALLGKKN